MNNLSNVVWGLDPKDQKEIEFFSQLFEDSDFIAEVEKITAGVKPNLKFYQSAQGLELLGTILDKFSSYNLLNAKLSDGFNTEKGVINNYVERIDAITIAPASGDDASYIQHLQDHRGVDIFSMGAMSFPGTIGELILGKYEFQLAKVQQNLQQGVAGIVMGATAYNPDIDVEIKKIRAKLQEKNIEYVCLEGYTDAELIKGIELRNQLFSEIYSELENHSDVKVLVPGFGRQGGNTDNFRMGSNNSKNPHIFNAGSDIGKELHDGNSDTTKTEILARLLEFSRQCNTILT